MILSLKRFDSEIEEVTNHFPVGRDGVEGGKLNALNALDVFDFVHFLLDLVLENIGDQVLAVLLRQGNFLLGLPLDYRDEVLVVLLHPLLLLR